MNRSSVARLMGWKLVKASEHNTWWEKPDGSQELLGLAGPEIPNMMSWLNDMGYNVHLFSPNSSDYIECNLTDHNGEDWGTFNADTIEDAIFEAIRCVASNNSDDDGFSPDVNSAILTVIDYAYADSQHNKQWVIDQIMRSLLGPNGYQDFVDIDMEGEWDEGIAP